VIGAFAITSDPVLIAIGLGIGAFFIRSITIYLVRSGSLTRFVYLEHGAMWAIGALAAVLVTSIAVGVPEWVTAALGIAFIGAAIWSSVRRNRRADLVDGRETEGLGRPEDRLTAAISRSPGNPA
jgi:hypothetical protein